MEVSDRRFRRSANPVFAVIYGALIALVASYGGSYILTRFGYGVIGASGKDIPLGPTLLMKALLNLYAMQHITLAGSAEVVGSVVNAKIILPLTVWAIVPAISLFLGGYGAAMHKAGYGRWKMAVPALLSGFFYVVALAALSFVTRTNIESFLLPTVNGISANPPDIPFQPDIISTLIFGLIFGLSFSYAGALLAIRITLLHRVRGKWWACGKAVLSVALVLQLFAAGAIGVWVIMSSNASENKSSRMLEMIPTGAGIGYAMIHDATVTGSVESKFQSSKPFHGTANLYTGIDTQFQGKDSHKNVSDGVKAGAAILGCIASFLMGFFAVKWGSRDGNLPTALRIGAMHTIYLVCTSAFCNLGLITSFDSITVGISYGTWILFSFLGVTLLSFMGAFWGNRTKSGISSIF